MWQWILRFLRDLFIGPLGPSILEYWEAIKAGQFVLDPTNWDETEPWFGEAEVRLHNPQVMVACYQEDGRTSVAAKLGVVFGELAVTVWDGEITAVTKDGMHLIPELMDIELKELLFKIVNQVEQIVRDLKKSPSTST